MMRSFMNPAEILRLQITFGLMLAEAQMVIGMRLMGMAGMWRVAPSENARMVSEKLAAAQEASRAATRAAMQGKSAAIIADHALKPIRRRTSANAKRLARRGPGTP
jgi:hypothetical protein